MQKPMALTSAGGLIDGAMKVRNAMKERIAARLEELDLAPTAAATRVGLNRYYLYDLLTGKKDTLKRDDLPKVAETLQCTVDFLLGDTLLPVGVCHAGGEGECSVQDGIQCPVDEQYPSLHQEAWVVSGDGLSAHGIPNGATVVLIARPPYPGEPFLTLDSDQKTFIRVKPTGSGKILGSVSLIVTRATRTSNR